jgi:hypothetical protein
MRDAIEDIHDELYGAVYADDLAGAKRLLDELAMITGDNPRGRRIRAAKRAAEPLLWPQLRLLTPEVLPAPGHLPGSTIRNPYRA